MESGRLPPNKRESKKVSKTIDKYRERKPRATRDVNETYDAEAGARLQNKVNDASVLYRQFLSLLLLRFPINLPISQHTLPLPIRLQRHERSDLKALRSLYYTGCHMCVPAILQNLQFILMG